MAEIGDRFFHLVILQLIILPKMLDFDEFHSNVKSPVKIQKEKSQNGDNKKKSKPDFPKNEHFLLSDTHTYVRVHIMG